MAEASTARDSSLKILYFICTFLFCLVFNVLTLHAHVLSVLWVVKKQLIFSILPTIGTSKGDNQAWHLCPWKNVSINIIC